MKYTYEQLAKSIDHALLGPTLTTADLGQGIQLALTYDVASVCIMPYFLRECADRLAGSTVKTSTTIGFPHGNQSTGMKVAEAEQAIADGCQELDMVVNISKVLSGDWDYVHKEVRVLIELTHAAGQWMKVIFENCYLNDEQKIQLCQICSELNADWIKTSTGFGSGGATADDLKLMQEHTAEHVQIKAAGGIRDLETLIAMRQLGATRCGASNTKEILDAARLELNMPAISLSSSGKTSY